jgi:hypothetical protein
VGLWGNGERTTAEVRSIGGELAMDSLYITVQCTLERRVGEYDENEALRDGGQRG